jgi:hypothetical protein
MKFKVEMNATHAKMEQSCDGEGVYAMKFQAKMNEAHVNGEQTHDGDAGNTRKQCCG